MLCAKGCDGSGASQRAEEGERVAWRVCEEVDVERVGGLAEEEEGGSAREVVCGTVEDEETEGRGRNILPIPCVVMHNRVPASRVRVRWM